ncbi:haloacid dehalogenase type II [Beijerinckia sp. L45]|uniref:haloacid dehalogenase type II n=1 Tax=Beijerinckia sp. L45 TaxID=1641855 RepID=UPI00131D6F27|nr:haloacid dehalogenase type II [Beijerinckia sp. L45]
MSASVYVFDAYGTLFDVHSAIGRYRDMIGPQADRLSEMWRIKQLEYTWTLSLMGRFRDFADVTAAALDVAAAGFGGLPNGLRPKLLAAYEELEAYPDVAPALQALRAKGAKTAILSNGTEAMLARATQVAGLNDLFDAVISIDALKLYKPAPAVYGLVGKRFVTTPAEVSFQSSNRWDIAGAKAFGFHTTWINRTGKPDEYLDLPPDRIVASLHKLI